MKILYLPVFYYPAYLAWDRAVAKGRTQMRLRCDGVGLGVLADGLNDQQVKDAWAFFTNNLIIDEEITIYGNSDNQPADDKAYPGHRRFIRKWVDSSLLRSQNLPDVFPTLTNPEADNVTRAMQRSGRKLSVLYKALLPFGKYGDLKGQVPLGWYAQTEKTRSFFQNKVAERGQKSKC